MKKNPFYFSVLLILFGCNACNKDNSTQLINGVAVSLPHLWVLSTRNDNTPPSGGAVLTSINYNGNILVGGIKNGDNSIIMINSKTGEKIWEWQDWIEKNSNIWVSKPLIKNNLLFFQLAYWNYCIDLNNGKTVFKNVFNGAFFGSYFGIDNYIYSALRYYRTGIAHPKDGASISRANIFNGQQEYITTPKYDSTGIDESKVDYGYIAGVSPFLLNNDTLLAIGFTDPPTKNGFRSVLGIYNLNKKKWNVEREIIDSVKLQGVYQEPQTWQNKVYLCGSGFIVCNDAITGKNIWRIEINGGFLFSGFIIQNGRVYANDSYGNLHCMDANTGKQYWTETTSGTSSDMVYLDGVVYLVGGGDGLLHAVDAETGTTLWKVKSPDAAKFNDGNFDRFCAAVPGSFGSKGRIIVSTGYNAYCYEAAK